MLMCKSPDPVPDWMRDPWEDMPCTGFEALRWEWRLLDGRYTPMYNPWLKPSERNTFRPIWENI